VSLVTSLTTIFLPQGFILVSIRIRILFLTIQNYSKFPYPLIYLISPYLVTFIIIIHTINQSDHFLIK
jgi:hypothetical protein